MVTTSSEGRNHIAAALSYLPLYHAILNTTKVLAEDMLKSIELCSSMPSLQILLSAGEGVGCLGVSEMLPLGELTDINSHV